MLSAARFVFVKIKFHVQSKVKSISINYVPVDFSVFTCLQDNLFWQFSKAKHETIIMVEKLNEQFCNLSYTLSSL